MSNHAKVITKLPMTPAGITAILNRLNETRFKNLLTISYAKGSKGSWGKHNWYITVTGDKDGRTYGGRECWLNNAKSFEIRHAWGGTFFWWIDFSITNEVALSYSGTTRDDADDEKVVPEAHKYDSWGEFSDRMNRGRGLPVWESEYTPKEFLPPIEDIKMYDVDVITLTAKPVPTKRHETVGLPDD